MSSPRHSAPGYLWRGQVPRGRRGRRGQLGRLAGQGSLRLEALQGALAQAARQRIAIAAGLTGVPTVSWTISRSHQTPFPSAASGCLNIPSCQGRTIHFTHVHSRLPCALPGYFPCVCFQWTCSYHVRHSHNPYGFQLTHCTTCMNESWRAALMGATGMKCIPV